jgi:hypothetical protein
MRSQRAVVVAVSLLSAVCLGASASPGQSGQTDAAKSQTNRTEGLAAWHLAAAPFGDVPPPKRDVYAALVLVCKTEIPANFRYPPMTCPSPGM